MPDEFLYSDLTYQIRGCCFEVMKQLGGGHKEVVYQRALEMELKDKRIPFVHQPRLQVKYKDELVGTYIPDLLIDSKVIIELKSVEILPIQAKIQLENYLKGSEFEVGFLINYGNQKLEIIRKVWFNH